jgi:hypothetical protein
MSSMRFASRPVLAKNIIKLFEKRVVERLQAEYPWAHRKFPKGPLNNDAGWDPQEGRLQFGVCHSWNDYWIGAIYVWIRQLSRTTLALTEWKEAAGTVVSGQINPG